MTLFQKIIAENTVFNIVNGSKILAFVELILSPIQSVRDKFDAYIAEKRYEMSFNGQIIYLEHLLNDRFDNTLRRITITDIEPLDNVPAIIYNFVDNSETAMIYNIGDVAIAQSLMAYGFLDINIQYDFILNVPTALAAQNLQIKKMLDQYKEASNQYVLINF
jgi:hypothetical protein